MYRIRLAIIALVVIFLLYFVPYYFATRPEYGKMKIFMGGKEFVVRVADTKTEREKGLSGTSPLGEDEGMIFVFNEVSNYGFWMKDMQYSLDIIWVGEDLKITHIEKSISPETYPKVFYPTKPSRYAVEILSGQADILKLKAGDSVFFSEK